MEFQHMLHSLWYFYSNGTSVHNAAQLFMSKRYFQFSDVCFATIQYWFQRFATNFCYPECIRIINIINVGLRMECLLKLQPVHPSWTIYHYMDALKLPKNTAEWFLRTLHKINSGQH
ncbi:hypothetical protein M0802_016043 [Mischocyttarus mexicanus]|nr:hypothetical protein M0802_016043 [Mischocyttarus mexicanus]